MVKSYWHNDRRGYWHHCSMVSVYEVCATNTSRVERIVSLHTVLFAALIQDSGVERTWFHCILLPWVDTVVQAMLSPLHVELRWSTWRYGYWSIYSSCIVWMGLLARHIMHFPLSMFVKCGTWVVYRDCCGVWETLRLSFQLRSWAKGSGTAFRNYRCSSADCGRYSTISTKEILQSHERCAYSTDIITTGASLYSKKSLDERGYWCGSQVLPSL